MTPVERFEKALAKFEEYVYEVRMSWSNFDGRDLRDRWLEDVALIRSAHAACVEEARLGSTALRAHAEHRPSVQRIRTAHSWFPVSNAAGLTDYERQQIPGVGHRVYCQTSAESPEGCYICALLTELEHEHERGLHEGTKLAALSLLYAYDDAEPGEHGYRLVRVSDDLAAAIRARSKGSDAA